MSAPGDVPVMMKAVTRMKALVVAAYVVAASVTSLCSLRFCES